MNSDPVSFTASEMSRSRTGLSARLRAVRSRVLEHWEAFPRARSVSATERWTIERILDEWVGALGASAAADAVGRGGAIAGEATGEWDLPRLIEEHGLLRRAIRRALPALAGDDWEAIDAVAQAGLIAAAAAAAEADGVLGRVRERLALERHKLQAIFRESPAALALWQGPELVYEMVNPRYQAIFPGRQLLGRSFREANPELRGLGFEENIRRVFDTGEPFVGLDVHMPLPRHAGAPPEDRYFDLVFTRVTDAEGNAYGVFDHAVEVTDRVLAQRRMDRYSEQLSHAVDGLEAEREVRERFVAALTHDLRTPLTAAKISAQLIARKAEDAKQSRTLALKIAENIDRGDRMIRDLLDANLIRAGERLPLDIGDCDLNQLAVETLGELATVHGDRFVLEAPAVPIRGRWSCAGVERALENLCNNAVKYGAKDRPITVTLGYEGDRVSLAVQNWGPPISPEDQRSLFQQYRRTASARAGREKGWGLGLTLVKGLAEAHGGTVTVESSAERGTTFRLVLPADAGVS